MGAGLASHHTRLCCVEVRQLPLENAWDITDLQHQRGCLDLMDKDCPDEAWLSPMCGPWSQMQELNSLTPKAKDKLQELRDWC